MSLKKIIVFVAFFAVVFPILKAQNGVSVKISPNTSLTEPSVSLSDEEIGLCRYLENAIRYPYILAKIKMEGEVDVLFSVNSEGRIDEVQIVKGFDPLADDEVVRAIHSLPKWEVTSHADKNIKLKHQLQINFTLNDDIIAQAEQMSENGAKDDEYIGALLIDESQSISEQKDSVAVERDNSTIVKTVDPLLNKAPQFPGGEDALTAYIQANLKYPKRALQMKIEGRVIFNLLISSEGEISRIALFRGIYRDCNDEAFYLVKKMPKWIPGIKDGKPTAMEVMLPIPFVLSQ